MSAYQELPEDRERGKQLLKELVEMSRRLGQQNPLESRIAVNKRTHRIRFENETEDAVTIVIERSPMTSEEMERAIETLLNNQANYELQLERTNRQLERTDRQLEQTDRQVAMLAESQREFMQIVLQHIES